MKLKRIVSWLPHWAREPLRRTKNFALSWFYRGERRFCPVCGQSSRKFRRFGAEAREDARCPHCGSLERHRFTWLYFRDRTDLFDGSSKTMLHVAPEACFEPRLKKALGPGYISADLADPKAMVKMDVTAIPYPDGFFDVIYCSHVLEHVQDDRRAMREFHRVLKAGGWAVLNVPVRVAATVEDPSITDPAGRLAAFGQADHVRRYGRDYADRLREAGFWVMVIGVSDLYESEDRARMGLTPASGEIHFCSKT